MKFHYMITVIIFFVAQLTMAAHIEKVKAKKVLIVLDGLSVETGATVEAISSSTNKKTAILKITKVKDNKAIAELLRGKVKVGQEIQSKDKSAEVTPQEMPTSKKKSRKSKSKGASSSTFAVGALLGLGFDTMKLNLRDASGTLIESITQTGIGYSLMGSADLWLNSWFSVRGLAGIEQFNAEADSTQGASPCASCETKITYFNAVAWGRIHLIENVWFGPGIGLQQPLSVSTNAIDDSTVGTSVMYGFAAGADIALGDSMYMPLQVEYGTQDKSPDVESSYYGVRLGVMLRY